MEGKFRIKAMFLHTAVIVSRNSKVCGFCGQRDESNDKYCVACGTRLIAALAPADLDSFFRSTRTGKAVSSMRVFTSMEAESMSDSDDYTKKISH